MSRRAMPARPPGHTDPPAQSSPSSSMQPLCVDRAMPPCHTGRGRMTADRCASLPQLKTPKVRAWGPRQQINPGARGSQSQADGARGGRVFAGSHRTEQLGALGDLQQQQQRATIHPVRRGQAQSEPSQPSLLAADRRRSAVRAEPAAGSSGTRLTRRPKGKRHRWGTGLSRLYRPSHAGGRARNGVGGCVVCHGLRVGYAGHAPVEISQV